MCLQQENSSNLMEVPTQLVNVGKTIECHGLSQRKIVTTRVTQITHVSGVTSITGVTRPQHDIH